MRTARGGAPPLILDGLRLDREGDAWVSSMRCRGHGLDDGTRLRLRLHDTGRLHHSRDALDDGATPFVPIATVLACLRHERLVVDAPVDASALTGAGAASRLLAGWFAWGDARPWARGAVRTVPPASGVALFFSRGLDSFYTLGQHPETNHLIGIDWIDAPPATPGVRAVWDGTVAAADDLGLPLLRVSTDARWLLDPLRGWSDTFGAVLASLSLLLAPQVGQALVSSTERADLARPHGSHPDLDPKWTSSRVVIRHEGVTAGRTDKAAVVADDPFARRWLKVCWERDGDGNCGRCAKCLMTLSSFAAVGRLDAIAHRFDAPLSADAVRAISAAPRVDRQNIVEVHDRLPDGPLRDAWAAVLASANAP